MLLILADHETPRLKYITKLIFKQLCGIEYNITTSVESFNQHKGPALNYSSSESGGTNCLRIEPVSLLFEHDIQVKKVVKSSSWYGLPAIALEGEVFDPLAMSFYLVSRYEEYGGFTPDDHKRFPASASCLVQLGLIQKPLVNLWALRLLDLLKEKYPNLEAKPRKYRFASSIDIDQAWKFRHKGFVRNAAGFLRDALKGQWSEVRQRLQVLTGYIPDPFFNFNWQRSLHVKHDTEVQYFVLLGQRGKFDKNTSIEELAFRDLIEELNTHSHVGLHPSYRSNTNFLALSREKSALENILAHDVEVSRQHYLMHKMPDTYERLMDLGIKQDHTMGYSTHAGFRAGIAAPFQFFNLQRNAEEKLELIPFCLMDITPLHYMGLKPEQGKELCADLIWEVKNVGGLFVSLWHNESLSEDGRWKGWRRVYEYLIEAGRSE